MNRTAVSCLLALAAGLSLPGAALALGNDSNQPIQLEADRAELNEGSGTGVYRGNVVLTQGTIQLRASRLDVKTGKRGLQQAVATGSPVRFRQQPAGDQAEITAEASRVEYQGSSGRLLLLGNARVQQGRNSFSGERIEYDLRSETVLASGGSDSKPGRVQMIIAPPAVETPAPAPETPEAAPAPETPPAAGEAAPTQ